MASGNYYSYATRSWFKKRKARWIAKHGDSGLTPPKNLQDFLPFKPMRNDPGYNQKVIGLAVYELLPHRADISGIAILFYKQFSTKLTTIDDDITSYYLSLVLPILKKHFNKLKITGFLHKNFKLLREYFGLSELETQILIFFKVANKYDVNLLDKECTYSEVLSLVSSFFYIKRSEARHILSPQGTLRSSGFLERSNDHFRFGLTNFTDLLLSVPFLSIKRHYVKDRENLS